MVIKADFLSELSVDLQKDGKKVQYSGPSLLESPVRIAKSPALPLVLNVRRWFFFVRQVWELLRLMDLSQETPKKEVKSSFSEMKTRSQCFLTFFMYGTQRKWQYLYSTLVGTRGGASSSMVGPLRAEVVPVSTPVIHSQPTGVSWEVRFKTLVSMT